MKAPRKRHQRSLREIFMIPLAIAIISIFGLVAALTGDGIRDALSWAGLAVPVIVIWWAWNSRH